MSQALVSRFFNAVRAHKAVVAVGLACGLAMGAAQAQDLYVNATVGGAIAPGVYGQINFGSQPPPPVLYAQPVWVQRGPVQQPPLYLYVPPGHSKHWAQHCARYNACGRPVYFVNVNQSNRWWDHDRRGPQGDRGRHEERRDDHRDDRRDDRRDERRDDFRHGDHGEGRGHGNGNR